MQAEDLVVNQGGEGEVIEEVGEVFPDIGVAVFSKTFVVEAVDLGDLAGFVVATENGDSLWISDLKSYKEGDCFHGVISTINIVTWKDESVLWSTCRGRVTNP